MNNKSIYALGFFDGVHLGHQALLRACRELADRQGCQAGLCPLRCPLSSPESGQAKVCRLLRIKSSLELFFFSLFPSHCEGP